MAYVSVPKDLEKVKNKLVLNMTRRQIICLAAAAAMGLPFYFLTRNFIGNSSAASGMAVLMLPSFLFAMYEKDGLPLEKILMNIISVKLLRPAIRRYEVRNLYSAACRSFAETGEGGHGSAEKKSGRAYSRSTVLAQKGEKNFCAGIYSVQGNGTGRNLQSAWAVLHKDGPFS